MATLRTRETHEKYKAWLAAKGPDTPCPLCAAAPLQQFGKWKIIGNDFPYDRVASLHHMLVPLRHVAETMLTNEERDELLEIKRNSLKAYEYSLEATPGTLSIPEHFHLHLLDIKNFD